MAFKKIVVALALWSLTVPAFAQDTNSGGLTLGQTEILTLGDLRDLGLCINQLQQQTKNIYMEATRKQVPASADPHIEDLKVITSGSVDAEARYEPLRPEWLTYYVGAMEPIIQLFKANLESTRTGATRLMVPASTVKHFSHLLSNYDGAIARINSSVDVIHQKIGDPHANVAVAQEAVKLFEVTEELEKARHHAFNLIKKADRRGETREPVPAGSLVK